MKRIIILTFLLLAIPAYAQQGVVVGPISPCSAFGTASGTCLQGAGALGTPSSGTATNLTGTATGLTAGNVSQITGVTAGTAAGAGVVGEVLIGSAALDSVSATTTTAANVTTVSLTAGDWDVSGVVYYLAAATTAVTAYEASISQTSATRDLAVGHFGSFEYLGGTIGSSARTSISIPPFQINISSPTTIYLVQFATFSVSTVVSGGSIFARRRR